MGGKNLNVPMGGSLTSLSKQGIFEWFLRQGVNGRRVMKYWTFKHQPGKNKPENECKVFVEQAIKLNSALMQYEYGQQDQGQVTANWNFIKNNLQEGDILFLRGSERIYAVGKIIKPRTNADEVLKMADIIEQHSHKVNKKVYRSDKYDGCIHFEDCPIFYENLSDGEEGWGQRIDVQAWKYYFPEGIECKKNSNYVEKSSVYNVVRELKKDKAKRFINQLEEKFMGPKLELLKANKNLILTGAPGTGKTFLARNMALKLIFGKDDEKLLSAEEQAAFENQYRFVQFHPSYDYTDFVEGLRPTKPGASGNIGFERQDGVFKKFCKTALKACVYDADGKLDEEKSAKCVFVIDEINRGEISKIFGELFFSIDPGYRGVKGSVQTQYTNLISDDDPFKKGFYVPENVYIIGTMNDIDRSVESFDFAMRRRFVWQEITAKESAINMGLPQPAIDRLESLNKRIADIPGFNSSYHIGAAYLLKKDSETVVEPDYPSLWMLRLKPLLREYLRGMPDAKERLAELHRSFEPNYTGDSEE
jgi:hypothetical protein